MIANDTKETGSAEQPEAPPQDPRAATEEHDGAETNDRGTPLRDAFRLGWALVELRSRLEIAAGESDDRLGPTMRLSSVWRSGFNRLAALHKAAFPSAATAGGLYDPPPKEDLPYLYPPESDYANVGINGLDLGRQEILPAFRLYDVTRRAINCLTLLYLKPDESLVADMVVKNQAHLVAAIVTAPQNPGAGGGNDPAPVNGAEAQSDLQRARQILTERIRTFLAAWDGYVRENYYTGGAVANDDLELVAYEAGHSMSSISWGISAATIPARNLAKADATAAGTWSASREQIMAQFADAWRRVFERQSMIRLQHQITALSAAFDDAYRSRRQQQPQTAAAEELPSEAIHAVKQSLDYWQRSVEPMCKQGWEAEDVVDWYEGMRVALTQQANIWQTLMTGQQGLRAFSVEAVTSRIMQRVTDHIQKSATTDLHGLVRQGREQLKAIQKEAFQALEDARHVAASGVETLFKSMQSRLWLAGVALLIAIVITGGVALWYREAGPATIGTLMTTLGSAVAGFLGMKRTEKEKETQQQAIAQSQETAKEKVGQQADQSASLADRSAAAGSNT